MNMTINKKILWVPAILLFISIIIGGYNALASKTEVLTGEIEATQIDVAAKVPGRIDSILVKEGDVVNKHEILAVMNSPEIEAKYDQAKGAVKSAKAMLDMAMNGARSEEVKAAFEMYQAAKAQFEFVEKSYNRMKKLFEENIISKQMYDEMEFKYNAARAKMVAAEQQWNMAKEGARKEQIVAAEGQYDRALNTLREVEVYLDETKIKAPQRGEVDNILVDPGELVATGYPIISIVDLNDIWLTIYVPETKLNRFKKDEIFNVIVPAIHETEPFEFVVQKISAVGDFATKRATNEKGSFDIKTFEVRLRPVKALPDLRPGMSGRVLINN
ncbi:MAG: efflux RND transporter periplasmic adaptor subunit [Calditrichia bacterium]